MGITFNDEKLAREYAETLKEKGISPLIIKDGKQYIVKETTDLICPFCEETGFDKMGLKNHFEHGDCDKYNNIKELDRLF